MIVRTNTEYRVKKLLQSVTQGERRARAHAMLRKLHRIERVIAREMRNEAQR